MLEKELRSIIDFDSDDVKGIRKQNLNQGNLSMVKDDLESINPIDADDKKPKELGNILVVDDNKNNTDLLYKRLSKKGHSVVTANNGKDAILRLTMDREGIDVILLDIVMPEMNGYEVLKFIKNDKTIFEDGMCFHFQSGVWLDNFGAAISESIVIGKNGAERLCNVDRKLFKVN